jgi:hypothetical protein
LHAFDPLEILQLRQPLAPGLAEQVESLGITNSILFEDLGERLQADDDAGVLEPYT